jgi:hypothetical protein
MPGKGVLEKPTCILKTLPTTRILTFGKKEIKKQIIDFFKSDKTTDLRQVPPCPQYLMVVWMDYWLKSCFSTELVSLFYIS